LTTGQELRWPVSQAVGAGFHAVHGKPPRLPDLAALVARLAGVP